MLEYNTGRNHLIIKEYGRNVQKMTDQCMAIEDYQERTTAARAIIKVMSQINPENKDLTNPNALKDSDDYWHKLWDHLFMISDYQLDVDAPFPKPIPETQRFVPSSHAYRKSKIKYRTYGRNLETIIQKSAALSDEERAEISKSIANNLKRLYLTYNRDSVDDALISTQLSEMSDGKLYLPDEFSMESTKNILQQHQIQLSQAAAAAKNRMKSKNKNKNKNKNKKQLKPQ
ncbi:MAG: DUF4290 domain-containing protein [Bacteroidales bacterium]|jgi:hypothetical protein|nr:DUF4290 domain-containing protein [Bacteroidales bacterium]